jgi:hypothetical protein
MFSESLIRDLTAAATANAIEPAALLAIAEVETGGKTFEQDGRTPAFLFERHIFYRELSKRSKAKLAIACAKGLAIPHWSKATQYKDERTSAMRLDLIARARGVDEECADRSCSWGIGQTMGNLAEELGFANAIAMIDHMVDGGVAAQIDCMVRELKHSGVADALNKHEWSTAARKYNGAGYAANQYDVKLRAAWARWSRKLAAAATAPTSAPAAQPKPVVAAAQEKLRKLGYAEVGMPTDEMDTRAKGATAAFQAHEGLPVNGELDPATIEAMDTAAPREVAPERAQATVKDLRAAGSRTIAASDQAGLIGKLKMWFGGLLGAGAGAERLGLLDTAQGAVDKANQAKGIWQSVHDLIGPLLGHPAAPFFAVAFAIGGFFIWRNIKKIEAARLDDHRTGVHAGSAEA